MSRDVDADEDDEHGQLKRRLAAVARDYLEAFGDPGAAVLRSDLQELIASGIPARPAKRPLDPTGTVPTTLAVSTADELLPGVLGRSAAMREVAALVRKVAPTDSTVYVHGESGTGKELIARAIHDLSRRANGPYVAENCAALPETLLESELFGHMRGAFTGADRNRKGRFAMAHTGTLFLDEVGDMSGGLQKKLLRALQEGEIRPVGGTKVEHVDVRFLSASNKDLAEMARDGTVREDVYWRLSPIRIDLPPLRDRGEDVLLLADRFSADLAAKMGRPAPTFTDEVRAAFLRHQWPGNVRELQNELQRLLAFSTPDEPIGTDLLSPDVRGT